MVHVNFLAGCLPHCKHSKILNNKAKKLAFIFLSFIFITRFFCGVGENVET